MTEQLPDEQTVVSTSTHTSMPFWAGDVDDNRVVLCRDSVR
jgi:hypothetical protein